MKVHVLQHVSFEGLGSIAPWLEARNAEISYSRFFEPAPPQLPSLDDTDLVIALGGPMSVNDERSYPWLAPEKSFLRRTMGRHVPLLGICLGAQLIASALGASVRPNPEREIGWFSIHSVDSDRPAFRFPANARVFHWHGETFDLPEGAIHLARSAACEHQAFQIGANVIGLQFHLETTSETLDTLIRHSRNELVDGPFVQPEAVLRSAAAEDYARIHALMDQILEYLLG